MNLKNKETQLFESLNKLDSIADLIKTSKEESSYLKKLSHQTREHNYHVLHFATHSHDDQVKLSGDEIFKPADVARASSLAQANLVFFNSCRSGLLASYAVRHGLAYSIYTNSDLPDAQAWKMPLSFYENLSAHSEIDYVTAFLHADVGDGIYGLVVAPQLLKDLPPISYTPEFDDVERLRRLLKKRPVKSKREYKHGNPGDSDSLL